MKICGRNLSGVFYLPISGNASPVPIDVIFSTYKVFAYKQMEESIEWARDSRDRDGWGYEVRRGVGTFMWYNNC